MHLINCYFRNNLDSCTRLRLVPKSVLLVRRLWSFSPSIPQSGKHWRMKNEEYSSILN